ncbi:hypothetical protein QCA50_006495 [Cerrena zonata]|uniref:Enoyl reductase (ER) domain-containing protein n=1 Tax=Cerrena zonata TaxID=2478898 RepID=A0AAW0G917_9APHY
MSLPESYKAYAFTDLHGDLKPVTIDWKDPAKNEVVVKVLACGVCAGDEIVRDQIFPTGLPRIPGHEIVGDIVRVGPGVTAFEKGDRVGSGWHGGHCFTCTPCLEGNFNLCDKEEINGIFRDGGYAEYATLRIESLVRIPEGMDPREAAPLMCAGVTVFNSLRNMTVKHGDVVAVQGIGGLGHLGIQFANKMGYHVVALSSSPRKREIALQLGASDYLDSSQVDQAAELQKIGGANVIITCAPSGRSMSPLLHGLAKGGTLLVLGATPDPLEVPTGLILNKRLSIRGWPCGSAKDCSDTLRFALRKDVKTLIEIFPLDKAQDAYDHRSSARFRAVLVPSVS